MLKNYQNKLKEAIKFEIKFYQMKNLTVYSIYIKYLLMLLVGLVSTPVYIITDGNIPAGECIIEEVRKLSYGLSVNDTSYVVVCKSRASNHHFINGIILIL